MALRYAILGLLSAEPMSGYDLAKWMDRGLANIWSAQASQIYPELARMVEAGVIVEVPGDTGPRRRRVYAISDAGAAELREWLASASPDPGGRSEALLRAVLLVQLEPRAAATAFAVEAERHRERAALHEALRDEAATAGSPLAPLRLAFDCGARIERALAEWAQAAADERPARRRMARSEKAQR
jgi:PadR family transcriptional regulator, regulatory protein AphA